MLLADLDERSSGNLTCWPLGARGELAQRLQNGGRLLPTARNEWLNVGNLRQHRAANPWLSV
jgi:hypothetical protein